MTLILAGMAELIAIATYIRLWLPNISAWLIEILILGILSIINLCIVRFFGKTESMLSIIKIIAIIALILVGIWMIAVHHKNPVGTSAGLGNVTKDYTSFPHGFREFLNAFPMVFFSLKEWNLSVSRLPKRKIRVRFFRLPLNKLLPEF